MCPFEATDQPACKRYILHLNLIPGLEKIRPGDVFTPAFDVFRCMQDYLRSTIWSKSTRTRGISRMSRR